MANKKKNIENILLGSSFPRLNNILAVVNKSSFKLGNYYGKDKEKKHLIVTLSDKVRNNIELELNYFIPLSIIPNSKKIELNLIQKENEENN